MLYLDARYTSILGHQGILRYLPLFGEFRDAIEEHFQKDRLYHDHRGNTTLVPGLSELPFNICGFIDNTIGQILVPFSDPGGDYEGAPCRPQIWSPLSPMPPSPPLTIPRTAAPAKAKEARATSMASDKCCALDDFPRSIRFEAMTALPSPQPHSWHDGRLWRTAATPAGDGGGELISGRSLGIF